MNSTILLILICSIVGLGTGVGFGLASSFTVKDDQIVPGIVIEGIAVGAENREEVQRRLQALGDELVNRHLILVLEGKTWEISLRELGVTADVPGTVEAAYQIGRQGSIWQRWQDIRDAQRTGKYLSLELVIDEQVIGKAIQALTRDFVTAPVDANFRVLRNDTVEVIPERPGREVDLRDAVAQVKAALPGIKQGAKKQISLRLVEVRPSLTATEVNKLQINRLLSQYTTQFDPTNTNRTYNIKVAADALNQQLIKPGETFSFNAVVGPRSQEAGYKEALVIVKNEFVPGIGGGVCQVSTTLYNAVLRANLPVVERSNHSLPVTYVPAGLDATVTYGGRDLKFANNTDGHLLLRTEVKKNTLTVKIFGSVAVKPEVQIINTIIKKFKPQVIYKEDPTLAEGKQTIEQKGLEGYQTQVYRVVKVQGQEVKRELISTDIYQPVEQVVLIGTKKVSQPEPKPADNLPPVQSPQDTSPGKEPGAAFPGGTNQTGQIPNGQTQEGQSPRGQSQGGESQGRQPQNGQPQGGQTQPGQPPDSQPLPQNNSSGS